MSTFVSYYAINTKLQARKKAFLSLEDWKKILSYSNVHQLTEFLKQSYGYKQYFEQSKTQEIHRSEIEMILQRCIVGEIEKMLYYFSGPYKAFMKTLLMKYEIYDLQLVMREVSRQGDTLGIQKHFVHSTKHHFINYNKLLVVGSMQQLIDTLKDTPYYDTLKTITQEDMVKREFHMEMKLYMLYYKLLMSRASELKKKDCEVVKKMIGKKIDLLNIQWIYRAIKYYHISKEEILIYSLPDGNISYSRLKRLIYTKGLDEFCQLANKMLGEELFGEGENDKDTFLVRNMDRILFNYIKKIQNKDTLAMPIQYIYSLEIEVDDLIAVTEGIRYELSKQEIQKYLVRTIE